MRTSSQAVWLGLLGVGLAVTCSPGNPVTNGLAAWYDASHLTLASGASVTLWPDASTNARDAVQSVTAARPVFLTNVLNGLPAVRFDGTDDSLEYDGTFLAASDYTVFVVEGRRSAKIACYFLGGGAATANANLHLGYRTDNQLTHAQYANDYNMAVPTYTNQQFFIHSFHLDATGGTGRQTYRDGALLGSLASTVPLASYAGARIGGYLATGNRYSGDLAEILLYNRCLNAVERNAVGHYLATKYALGAAYVNPADADIAVSAVRTTPAVVTAGDEVAYTLTAVNNGFTNATALVVTNALPAGLSFASASSAAYDGWAGTWTIGPLAYLASTTLTVRATVNASAAGAVLTVAAGRRSADQHDYAPANDTAAVVIDVRDTLAPADFAFRMRLDFPGYTRGATLTNFPVLVRLSEALPGFRYAHFASPDGNDLRFVAADGVTVLYHDKDRWDTNGASAVWVQVDRLAAGSHIWACWGNLAQAAPPPALASRLTWADGYAGVWHLNEAAVSDPARDAGPGARDAAPTASPGVVPGVVSGARGMTGIECFTAGAGVDLSYKPFTLSAWVNRLPNTTGDNMFFGGGTGAADKGLHCGFRNANLYFGLYADDGTCATDYSGDRGAWHAYTYVLDGAHRKQLYRDGQPVLTTGATNAFYQSTGLVIGGSVNAAPSLKGQIDEVRAAAGVARPADWVWAEWATVASNGTFTACGEVVGAPVIANLAPTGIVATAAVANGALSFTGAVPTVVTLCWGPTDGGAAWGGWAHTNRLGVQPIGPLRVPLTGLTAFTSYAYTFHATNAHGQAWATPSVTFRTRTDPYWTITPLADPHGRTVPSTRETVDAGADSAVYTFAPDTGYHLTNVLVDAFSIGVTNACRFLNVTADHTIQAQFGLNAYTVTVVQAAHGSIVPTNGVVVYHGGDASLRVRPDAGYYARDVYADGVSIGPLHDVTLTNVTAPRTVTALFAPLPYGMVTNGLVLWLNAGTVSQSNGTYVTAWQDLSGRGNHATQPGTGLAPRFYNDRLGPHCYFDGLVSHMRVAHEADFDFTTAATIVMVGRQANPAADAWRPYVAKNGEASGWQFREYNNVNRLSFTARGLTGPDTDGPRGLGDIQNDAVLAGRVSGLAKAIWYNGKSDGVFTYTGGAISTNDVAVSLGARDSGGIGAFASCDIYELLIFNRALSDRELNAAGFYLASKYGLPGDYTDPLAPTVAATGSPARSATRAVLEGTLTATGAAPTTVWACWGTADAGTNLTAWPRVAALGLRPQGPLAATAHGLAAGADYVYRLAASNAHGMAWSSAVAFEAGADPADYPHGLRLQFSGYTGATSLTNFPVLVRLSPALEGCAYTNFVSTLGGDLRFLDATRTETLNHEIDRWGTALLGADIGAVAAVGSQVQADTEVAVTGSGADIWDTADEFHYAYIPLSGNGRITARVRAFVNPGANEWCKAGVMIRENLHADTRYAFMLARPDGQTVFQYRSAAATNAAAVGGLVAGPIPGWVRIERAGNTLSGYTSADGQNWALSGQQTIAMATNALMGLAVASHTDGSLSTVTFDQLALDVTNSSCVWVQVPRLAGPDDAIWAVWGNPLRAKSPVYATDHSVWPGLFSAVWHLTERNALDRTLNGNHGTGTLNANAEGLIAGAQSFTNAGNIAVNGRLDLRNRSFSFEAWTRRSAAADNDFICGQGLTGDMLHIGFRDTGACTFAFWGDDLDVAGPWNDTTNWHHWACVYDAATRRQEVFRDGAALGSRTAGASLTDTGTFYIGARGDAAYNFRGLIDEARIANTTLTPDWIRASFSNQVANSTFLTFSAVPLPQPGTVLILR